MPNIDTLCQTDSEVNHVHSQPQLYFGRINASLAVLEHSPENKCMIMQCKHAAVLPQFSKLTERRIRAHKYVVLQQFSKLARIK